MTGENNRAGKSDNNKEVKSDTNREIILMKIKLKRVLPVIFIVAVIILNAQL